MIASLDSGIQVPHRRLDLLCDMLPEEQRIAVDVNPFCLR